MTLMPIAPHGRPRYIAHPMTYSITINGRPTDIVFRCKRRAVQAALALAKSEGGVTEFAEYSAGLGAWVCSPENQYNVRRRTL